ncbi:hypothetical protein EVA_04668 [gut metagenome]|uniref:Uncharacterized protein n=1 Tax=gut metagenome TaxID=749906 RepID=J9GW70_9ZZZZ
MPITVIANETRLIGWNLFVHNRFKFLRQRFQYLTLALSDANQ